MAHPQKPLLKFMTDDQLDRMTLQDRWYLLARAVEESLMEAGAVPGKDYQMLDLYKLAQPLVVEAERSEGLKMRVNENAC